MTKKKKKREKPSPYLIDILKPRIQHIVKVRSGGMAVSGGMALCDPTIRVQIEDGEIEACAACLALLGKGQPS